MKKIFIANWTVNMIREREVIRDTGERIWIKPQIVGESDCYRPRGEKVALFDSYIDAMNWIKERRTLKVQRAQRELEAAQEKLFHPVRFFGLNGSESVLEVK
jgi:hypothetical protein